MTDRIGHDLDTERKVNRSVLFDRFFPQEEKNIFKSLTPRPERDLKTLNIIPNKEGLNYSKKIMYDLSKLKKNNLNIHLILNDINPSNLERNQTNERIDSFVREAIVRHSAADPIAHPFDEARQFVSLTGLLASVRENQGRNLTVNGKRVTFDDGKYTRVDFMPGLRDELAPSKMTNSLSEGIQGITRLIEAIDKGSFKAAPVFVGDTNINMALIAQRLGFVIVDECRTPDGNINRDLNTFTVVGKLDDIRKKVQEFKNAGVDQRLAQRNQRLQLRPKTASTR